jgi:creatinine amidohydrolase
MTSPTHTTGDPHLVQVERMLPHQIEAAIAARRVVYLPLGSIEYHSHHLPLGLDGLTAHGVCTRAAASGGVVLPTLWFGTGGTHTAYPWTIMTPTAAPLAELVLTTLRRLSDLGVQLCALFTGHFADDQLGLIDTVAADWNATGARPHVLALAVNRTDAALAPDHAGIFETSLLHALAPELVQLHRLPSLTELPVDPPDKHGGWDHRHTPGHPLRGVMGPDPRTTDLHQSQPLLDQVVD